MNQAVDRFEILVELERYEEYEKLKPANKIQDTEAINEFVKLLRKKTKLDPNQLVQNAGSLTLIGKKVLPLN